MDPMGDILYHRRFCLISLVKSTCCMRSTGLEVSPLRILLLSLWRTLKDKAETLEAKPLIDAQGLVRVGKSMSKLCQGCGLFYKGELFDLMSFIWSAMDTPKCLDKDYAHK